jgi:hypothetical protein
MKKISTSMLMLMLALALPGISHASNKSPKEVAPISEPMPIEESNLLMQRLEEIKAIDKSDLNSTEKKELRNEVKTINKRLSSGGVYISIGGVIIILLLLIILF